MQKFSRQFLAKMFVEIDGMMRAVYFPFNAFRFTRKRAQFHNFFRSVSDVTIRERIVAGIDANPIR